MESTKSILNIQSEDSKSYQSSVGAVYFFHDSFQHGLRDPHTQIFQVVDDFDRSHAQALPNISIAAVEVGQTGRLLVRMEVAAAALRLPVGQWAVVANRHGRRNLVGDVFQEGRVVFELLLLRLHLLSGTAAERATPGCVVQAGLISHGHVAVVKARLFPLVILLQVLPQGPLVIHLCQTGKEKLVNFPVAILVLANNCTTDLELNFGV